MVAYVDKSTPGDLDVSLPNADRGIFHIEGANYWKFYNLEYGWILVWQ